MALLASKNAANKYMIPDLTGLRPFPTIPRHEVMYVGTLKGPDVHRLKQRNGIANMTSSARHGRR